METFKLRERHAVNLTENQMKYISKMCCVLMSAEHANILSKTVS